MATQHTSAVMSVSNYPLKFTKRPQAVFVASTRVTCPQQNLCAVPHTGSPLRPHTADGMSANTADYTAHEVHQQRKQSQPSLADSACSVRITCHRRCPSNYPLCTGCVTDASSSAGPAARASFIHHLNEEPDLPKELEAHRDFIQGLRSLYALLIQMHYVLFNYLQWPPEYAGGEYFEGIKFGPLRAHLMCFLPYPKETAIQRSSPELDLGSYGINYLCQQEAKDMWDAARPNELFIFKSGTDNGNFYIYNLETRAITRAEAFDVYTNTRPAKCEPARAVFGYQLSSLKPDTDSRMKSLYKRSGWPDRFDGEVFEKAYTEQLENMRVKSQPDVGQMARDTLKTRERSGMKKYLHEAKHCLTRKGPP